MRVKHSALNQIFKSAIDNWPEDEASLIAEHWNGLRDDGYSPEEMTRVQENDIAHMERVFRAEPDALDLIIRFNAELHRLLDPKLF